MLWEPAVRLVTLTFAVAAMVIHNRNCVSSSGLMWTFWFLYTSISVLILAHYLANLGLPANWVPVASGAPSFFTSVAFISLNFLLAFRSEQHSKTRPGGYKAPEDQEVPMATVAKDASLIPDPSKEASFPSKLTFAWFTGLIWHGFRRDLSAGDLWELSPSSSCGNVSESFEANLRRRPKAKKVLVSVDPADVVVGKCGKQARDDCCQSRSPPPQPREDEVEVKSQSE